MAFFSCSTLFQSTPSARRATTTRRTWAPSFRISIHALREEGDRWTQKQLADATDFNPRPPRGGRQIGRLPNISTLKFQSTPSARRATDGTVPAGRCRTISIHALREEGDRSTSTFWDALMYFNPRPPRGGRLPRRWPSTPPCRFQSTPSARRATLTRWRQSWRRWISIHALREEGDGCGTGCGNCA